MMRPSMFAWSVLCVLATLLVRVGGPSAQMDGGRPPVDVEQALCDIGAVFAKLSMIKSNADCVAGCAHGTGACPADWYPNSGDTCSAACGVVFEPFWDQCGAMLTTAGMGGMDEMGIFYDRCLESLYPPGVCGTFCNQHTYECFLADVQNACCDEDGRNCPDGQDIPNTCPVGCAVLFPEFLETCRAHVQEQAGLQEADYEEFETLCLDQDGLALVEYALMLMSDGCILDLSGGGNGGHRRRLLNYLRRLQGYLSQRFGASSPGCTWDEIDDISRDVDGCASPSSPSLILLQLVDRVLRICRQNLLRIGRLRLPDRRRRHPPAQHLQPRVRRRDALLRRHLRPHRHRRARRGE